MRWLRRLFPLTLAVLLVLVFSEPLIPEANAQSEGDISFMPNVIPELEIHFVEEFFRFEWLNHTFDLKLLIAYEEKLLSLRDFWEKTDRLMKWQNMCRRATESMYEFGYVVEDIPPPIADKVDYLLWKVEGASFGVSEIEVSSRKNHTILLLPDNLKLSYDDLQKYGYSIKVECDCCFVYGLKGKTSWFLDPITYAGNIITISQYTEDNPCTHEDVYQADVAGGWGVVTRMVVGANIQYTINSTTLQIGDGENETWFVDSNVQILFWEAEEAVPVETAYDVVNQGHLVLGILEDTTTERTGCGVSVKTNYYYYTFAGSIGSEIKLYGSESSCIDAERSSTIIDSYGEVEVINCIFQNTWAIYIEEDANYTLHNLMMYNITDYIWCGAVNSLDIEELSILYSDTQLILFDTDSDVYLKNFKGRDATSETFVVASLTADVYAINPDVDVWSFKWWSPAVDAEFYRQYTFDLTFTFQNGSYAEGTNVTISNTYLGTSDSWILTSNGSIPQQTYLMGHYNQTGGNTLYSYNPYCITATLDGYQTYTTQLNLTQQTNWTITLHEETGLATGFIFGGILTVLIMTVLGLTYIGKK